MRQSGFAFPFQKTGGKRTVEQRLRYIYDSHTNVTQNIAAAIEDISRHRYRKCTHLTLIGTKPMTIRRIWYLSEEALRRKLHVKGLPRALMVRESQENLPALY